MRKFLSLAIVFASYVSGSAQSSSIRNDELSTNQPRHIARIGINESVPIVLRGTIILPNGVVNHGYVAIVNGTQIRNRADPFAEVENELA